MFVRYFHECMEPQDGGDGVRGRCLTPPGRKSRKMNPRFSPICRLFACPADLSGLTMGAIAKTALGVKWKIRIYFCRVNGAKRRNSCVVAVVHWAGTAAAIPAHTSRAGKEQWPALACTQRRARWARTWRGGLHNLVGWRLATLRHSQALSVPTCPKDRDFTSSAGLTPWEEKHQHKRSGK